MKDHAQSNASYVADSQGSSNSSVSGELLTQEFDVMAANRYMGKMIDEVTKSRNSVVGQNGSESGLNKYNKSATHEFDDDTRHPLRAMLRKLFLEKGNNNFIVAWRLHFDSNFDGVLSFMEFCAALSKLEYAGDLIELWREIDTDGSNRITLDEIDPDSADVLLFFKEFCALMGGPCDLFAKIDTNNNGLLSQYEFAEGLTKLGWFDNPNCPLSVDTMEEVMSLLFPALDLNGSGQISPEELVFLEMDPAKKRRLEKKFEKARRQKQWAVKEGRPKSRKEATKFLNLLTKKSTPMGGVHWTEFAEIAASPERCLVEGIPDAPEFQLKNGRIKKFEQEFKPPPWTRVLNQELTKCDLTSPRGTGKEMREGIATSLRSAWACETLLNKLSKDQRRAVRTKKWKIGSEIKVHSLVKLTPLEKAQRDTTSILRLVYYQAARRLQGQNNTQESVPTVEELCLKKGVCLPMKKFKNRGLYVKPPLILPKIDGTRVSTKQPKSTVLRSVCDLRKPADLYLHYYTEMRDEDEVIKSIGEKYKDDEVVQLIARRTGTGALSPTTNKEIR